MAQTHWQGVMEDRKGEGVSIRLEVTVGLGIPPLCTPNPPWGAAGCGYPHSPCLGGGSPMMLLPLWLRGGGQEVPVLRSCSIHHESTSVGICKAVTHLPSQLRARLIARLATANLHGGAEPNEAHACLPWEQSVTTARAGGRLGVTRARGRTAVIAFPMKGPRVPARGGDTPEPAHPRASTHTSPLTQRTQ